MRTLHRIFCVTSQAGDDARTTAADATATFQRHFVPPWLKLIERFDHPGALTLACALFVEPDVESLFFGYDPSSVAASSESSNTSISTTDLERALTAQVTAVLRWLEWLGACAGSKDWETSADGSAAAVVLKAWHSAWCVNPRKQPLSWTRVYALVAASLQYVAETTAVASSAACRFACMCMRTYVRNTEIVDMALVELLVQLLLLNESSEARRMWCELLCGLGERRKRLMLASSDSLPSAWNAAQQATALSIVQVGSAVLNADLGSCEQRRNKGMGEVV